jgi:hypothetical protein
MEEQSVSIRISLGAYQELVLRKISSGVPITEQINRLLKVKNANPTGKRSLGKRNKAHA